MIVLPKIIAFDSSTLVNLSRDYWCRSDELRAQSRRLLQFFSDRGILVAFTITHVCELIRHDDYKVVRDRIDFLRRIPLVAWLRPYDKNWFPSGMPDVLRREIDAVRLHNLNSWPDILQFVREELWETGTGAELFRDDDEFWQPLRQTALSHIEYEQRVASFGMTNPGGVADLTLSDADSLPKRSPSSWPAYFHVLTADLKKQLEQFGDHKLSNTATIASEFTADTLEKIKSFCPDGVDAVDRLIDFFGVSRRFVHPKMTVAELGELGVYAAQLRTIGPKLRPPVELKMDMFPPDTLPSFVFERKLRQIQCRAAPRARNSDLNDAQLATLSLYCDGIEVDKRTHEHLTQLKSTTSVFKALMCPYFKSSNYSEIPNLLN